MAPGSRLQELTAKYMQNPRRFFVPLANEYRKAHDLDRAIALCREHLSSQPGHMSGHIVLARAYYEKGDIAAAREVFLTSVELDDENLIALRHLGDIARARNDITEARQWYARVLDADPQNDEMERVLRSLNSPAETEATPPPVVAAVMPFDEPAAAAELAPVSPETSELRLEPAIESALSDPTPPGLRAILAPALPVVPDPNVRGPIDALDTRPDPRTSLDRLDLSTLGEEPPTPPEAAEAPADGVGIQVDDGVGFLFDELDELVDPAAAGGSVASLPPVNEADFSAGIATPTQPAQIPSDVAPDELLSRPAFGALASFASWRTAQERETPPQVPLQPPSTSDDDDAAGLFAPSVGADGSPTAPEFVTETMAALYAQQGFAQQALDIYRELAIRSPDDVSLRARMVELERAVASRPAAKSLEDDADKALQFGELHDDAERGTSDQSMLEAMYTVSPPETDSDLASAFDSGWNAPASPSEDDWFGDTPAPDLSSDSGYSGDEIFGVSGEVFDQTAALGHSASRAGSGAPAVALESVFGSPSVVASDATAGEMLLALAAQMVGRLPKEAPTLPVPDILELPSAAQGDEVAGASPAPLLSFDRFFSGSGSPPRVRVDTPVSRQEPVPWVSPAPTPVPSLSPTFGGLPVIPPPPSAPAPAAWGGFDQFVPPQVPPTPMAVADASQPAQLLEPPAEPVVPSPPLVAPVVTPPVDRPSAIPDRARTVMPAALRPSPPAAAPAPTADESADKPPRSDFHRWLEELS